jgi:hypothetical protein
VPSAIVPIAGTPAPLASSTRNSKEIWPDAALHPYAEFRRALVQAPRPRCTGSTTGMGAHSSDTSRS